MGLAGILPLLLLHAAALGAAAFRPPPPLSMAPGALAARATSARRHAPLFAYESDGEEEGDSDSSEPLPEDDDWDVAWQRFRLELLATQQPEYRSISPAEQIGSLVAGAPICSMTPLRQSAGTH